MLLICPIFYLRQDGCILLSQGSLNSLDIILYYTILYYTMLYYTTLYYTILD